MELKVFDLGLIDFKKAWDFQKEIFGQVKSCIIDSALILCQHYPVITLGRNSDKRNILASTQELKNRGIKVFELERGGDVTYHGPGQLTVYPIINLNYLKKDIHWFLRELEISIISTLSEFSVIGKSRQGLTGVWVYERKIASIGISIKQWITFHGFTINVRKKDLSNFSLIWPCGMSIEMISMEDVAENSTEIHDVKQVAISKLRDTLSAKAKSVPFIKEALR